MDADVVERPIRPSDPSADYRTLGRGTLLLVLGTLVLFAASFASRVLIAQSFPLADWGLFNLALAITGLTATVALLGLDQAAARTLSFEHDPATRRAIVRSVVRIAVVSAIAASAGIFLFAPALAAAFGAPELAGALELFSIAVGATMLGLL